MYDRHDPLVHLAGIAVAGVQRPAPSRRNPLWEAHLELLGRIRRRPR